jgi:long-subunit fatty acid transport protein
MKIKLNRIFVAFFLAATLGLHAQDEKFNVVTTAVPILQISPDARAGGMGDVGVASLPDANVIFWNPAKLAFLGEGVSKLSLSYTPWLSRLVPDIDLAYLSFVTSLGDRQGLGVSLRYFSLGEINFRDDFGNSTGTFSPYEFSIDVAYALKFSDQWSGGIGLRYIYSDIAQGQIVQGLQTQPGQSVAADVAFYYKSREINMKRGQKGTALFGVNISNIGAKISYSESGQDDFIPTNLRIGGGYIWQFDEYNKIGFMLDMNKLLVPTPQIVTADGDTLGKSTDVDPLTGMIQALNPGAKPDGFNELMREIVWNVGAEWTYNDLFMVRAGYQYEDVSKGNRQYFTFGAGIAYSIFALDVAYLIPANSTVRSPLENTLRFTLSFDLGGMTSAE